MEIKALDLVFGLDFNNKSLTYKNNNIVYNSINEISNEYHLIRINNIYLLRYEEKDYLNYKCLGYVRHHDTYDLIYINNNFHANGLGIIGGLHFFGPKLKYYDKENNCHNEIYFDDYLAIDKVNSMLPFIMISYNDNVKNYMVEFNICEILPNLYLFTKKGNMIKKALKK